MKSAKLTYFVHGTTTDNENGISTGWNQGSLSKLGIEQSIKLKALVKARFDVAFCSDLKRAVDSASLTFGESVRIVQDKRIRECNYGDLNGAKSEVVEPLSFKSISNPFSKGESYTDVEKRVRGFLEDVLNNYLGKHVAVVGHKAPQLALEVILNGKTWEQAMQEDWRLKRPPEWRAGWEFRIGRP